MPIPLSKVDVLVSQGQAVVDAIRAPRPLFPGPTARRRAILTVQIQAAAGWKIFFEEKARFRETPYANGGSFAARGHSRVESGRFLGL